MIVAFGDSLVPYFYFVFSNEFITYQKINSKKKKNHQKHLHNHSRKYANPFDGNQTKILALGT